MHVSAIQFSDFYFMLCTALKAAALSDASMQKQEQVNATAHKQAHHIIMYNCDKGRAMKDLKYESFILNSCYNLYTVFFPYLNPLGGPNSAGLQYPVPNIP